MTGTRADIIREAEKWLGTPFHHEARLLGVGVDCGQLLIAVYGVHGFMPVDYPVEHYSADFALHRDEEWYLSIVNSFAHQVEVPKPGDIALYKVGRLFSHGAIVVAWPEIIHALMNVRQVLRDDGTRNPMGRWDVVFFSPFKDDE